MQFYCRPSCNKVADNFLTMFMNMQSQVQHLRTEVDDVKSKIDIIEDGNFTPQMIETITSISKEQVKESPPSQAHSIDTVNTEEIKNLIDKSSKDSIAETENRARRSKNLIVFGIPEAQSLEKEDRIREEYQKANTILNKISCHHKTTFVRRLGEYKTTQVKPRPLRLSFASMLERDEVLDSFRRTKRREMDEEMRIIDKNVSMKRDMTPLEQKEDTALFKEWKEKKDQSKESGDGAVWIRRNGRVINIADKLPVNKHLGPTEDEREEEEEEEEH